MPKLTQEKTVSCFFFMKCYCYADNTPQPPNI